MSVTPSDFLNSAVALSNSGDKDEMTQRNILSRAYYAAYHRAHELIPFENTARDKDVGMHRSYFDQLLRKKKGSVERIIGEKLKSMYSRRILADYRLGEDVRNDYVPVQLYASNALFKLLENPTPSNGSISVLTLQRKK